MTTLSESPSSEIRWRFIGSSDMLCSMEDFIMGVCGIRDGVILLGCFVLTLVKVFSVLLFSR